MGYNEAHKFLNQEYNAKVDFPVEYSIPTRSGVGNYMVIILPPHRSADLKKIRNRNVIVGKRDVKGETVNFAPTGTCPCCGRG